MKMLRVISTQDGFRRAGRAWSGSTEIPRSEFSEKQIKDLVAEPKLLVQEFEAEAAAEETNPPSDGAKPRRTGSK